MAGTNKFLIGSIEKFVKTTAMSTVTTSQPNFAEANVTSAAWSGNLAATAIPGEGWSGTFPTYTHEAGSTANLSIPVTVTKGEFYEIVYTQTGTSSANTFNIIFAATAGGTSGQTVKEGVYYNTTFAAETANNYGYLNIAPASGWTGTFTITSIRKASAFNSESMSVKNIPHIIKGYNAVQGGGGKIITTGNSNTANGWLSLRSNTTGDCNTANGMYSLRDNTTGVYNTANGWSSLRDNTTGVYNTANGFSSLSGNTTGNSNTASGYVSLHGNTTGDNNTANGLASLHSNTTGSNNTASGYYSGRWLSDGKTKQTIANNSIFIGANTKGSATDNQTNQIVIGHNAVGNGSNTITLGNSSITSLRCQVNAITALSDIRTKEDVEAANLDMCYEDVKRLPVSRYKYKDFTGVHLDKHVTGFLADEVEQVFPKSVQKSNQYFPVLDENGEQVYEDIEETDDDGNVTLRKVEKMFLLEDVKNITMTEAIPTLWGAVQKLIETVESQNRRIADLEAANG